MWYAVYDKSTNGLVSVGEVVANPLASHLATKELGEAFNQAGKVWDVVTLSFKIANDPFVESFVDKILNLPELASLSLNIKTTLKGKLIKILFEG